METFIFADALLPDDDLAAVTRMLRGANALLPAFSIEPVRLYDPTTFVIDKTLHGNEPVLLTDRNVFSRWVSAAESSESEVDGQQRLAAALMAFAICADFMIEPNIAVYELAATATGAEAAEELSRFRALGDVPAQAWADLALGRAETVTPPPALPMPPLEDGLPARVERRLDKWRLHYICLLEIAKLDLQPGLSPLERTLSVMTWMRRDFLFDAAALAFAFHFFSPRSQRRRMLKGLRSPIRSRALIGLRNAAWDLVLATQWRQMSDRAGHVVVLATFDQWLKTIIRTFSVSDSYVNDEAHLDACLKEGWTQRERASILSHHAALSKDLRGPDRDSHVAALDLKFAIKQGEMAILAWAP